MPLKEAPERTQSPEFSIMPLGTLDRKTRSIYVKRGMRILKDSGAEKTLRKVADAVKVDFPDAVLLDISSMLPRGVGLALEWDYQQLGPFDPPIDVNEHPAFKTEKGSPLLTAKSIGIFADPLTKEISIRNGLNYGVVIDRKKWKSNPTILESVVVTSVKSMVTNLRNVSSINNQGVRVLQ